MDSFNGFNSYHTLAVWLCLRRFVGGISFSFVLKFEILWQHCSWLVAYYTSLLEYTCIRITTNKPWQDKTELCHDDNSTIKKCIQNIIYDVKLTPIYTINILYIHVKMLVRLRYVHSLYIHAFCIFYLSMSCFPC